MKKILIACEESQAVTIAFRESGFEAYSCDILPCSGVYPEHHIKGDVMEVIDDPQWDKIISFQPCTDLSVSGARWFAQKRYSGSQEKAIRFFFEVWKRSNCSENPVGIMNGGEYIRKHYPELHEEMTAYGFPFKPSQIIQPWQFGHGETKATCLWLRDFPELKPTDIVAGREQKVWKMPPGPDRGKLRSKTFKGIAEAMAEQWGEYILKN